MSSNCAEITAYVVRRDQVVNYRGTVVVYLKIHIEHTHTFLEECGDLASKTGGTYTYHCPVKSYVRMDSEFM
jgi:hypothetical protein